MRWTWGEGEAEGVVHAVHEERVTRKIKGTSVVRDGSSETPALDIEQDNGDVVLKLSSEVSPA